MRLEKKVALITGAAKGIGAAIAELFISEGALVVVTDIVEPEKRENAQKPFIDSKRSVFVRLDVRSQEDWARGVSTALDTFHRLDILVNNAGIRRREAIEDCTLEQWDQVMAVNAAGTFLGIKSVVPVMKANRGGSIVNISSMVALVGTDDSTAYQASKGAVRSLTKAAAVQLARYGIRVNSIHPGTITTALSPLPPAHVQLLSKFFSQSPVDLRSRMLRSLIDRQGQPLEVAYGALYLACEESSYITGAELIIDGGYTAL